MKPHVHAESSAKQFGGTPEDYLDIHLLLDSSKGTFSDLRHRALTHNSWFITTILEKIFGVTRTNSDGKVYSVRDIGEQHVLEDFGMLFVPSAQDYLAEIELRDWMDNARENQVPPSRKKVGKELRQPSRGRKIVEGLKEIFPGKGKGKKPQTVEPPLRFEEDFSHRGCGAGMLD